MSNAIKNLARNKGRNILLAAVTLAIIIGAVVTLTIYNAASRVIDEIRLDLGSRVTIEQDIISMFRSGGAEALMENTEHIPIHDWIRFADSEYLSNAVLNADVIHLVSDTLTPLQRNVGSNIKRDVPFRLLGTSEPDENLSNIIVEGRMFEGLNEVIIDDDLARLNNLSIGDTIELETYFSPIIDFTGIEMADKFFELTVVGIYSADLYEQLQSLFAFADIFTSFDTVAAAGWENNFALTMSAEYFLRNPDYLEAFEQEVREKGLPDTYIVSINQAAFDRVTGPMLSMQSAVMTFSIVILILGAIVLALISFLVVRERKYEVGVLRAMGMEKRKVAFGVLAEAVMITTLCLVLGLGIGNAVAQPIADGLLDSRVVAAEAKSEELGHDTGGAVVIFGGQMQTQHSIGYRPESEITVGLNGSIIIQIIIVTLGLAALSGTIGVVVITRYEPLKILRERT